MNEEAFKLALVYSDQRKCHECWELKNNHEFTKQNNGNKCKSCYSIKRKARYQRKDVKDKERQHFLRSYFKRAYGITYEQYQDLLIKQNGCCAICKKKESRINPKSKDVQQLSVDHCHKTGKIRGLLCSRCNLLLGRIDDDILLLEAFIDYLQFRY